MVYFPPDLEALSAAEWYNLLISTKPNDIIRPYKDSESSFIEVSFPCLIKQFKDSTGINENRIKSCDSLGVWILRATQVSDDQIKLRLDGLLNIEVANYLFYYILDFWTESSGPLGNSLRELFLKLLIFFKKSKTAAQRTRLFESWTLYILDQSYTLRVVYFILEHLSKEIDATYIIRRKPEFFSQTIPLMNNSTLTNPAGKAIQTILKQLYISMDKNDAEWLKLWQEPVISSLLDERLRKNVQIYLLPYLFKISSNAYQIFIRSFIDNSSSDISCVLGCLRIGQELGLIEEPFHGSDALIDLSIIKALLAGESDQLRIGALAIITASNKNSKPIHPYVFEIVINHLSSFSLLEDMETRDEIFAILKQFISRARDSAYGLNRDCNKLQKKDSDVTKRLLEDKQVQLQQYLSFFKSLVQFLKTEIRPAVSHHRKDFAYKVYHGLLRAGLDNTLDPQHFDKLHLEFPFRIDLYDKDFLRFLVDNITDDFEDIRKRSVELLLMSPHSLRDSFSPNDLKFIRNRAFAMLKDIKSRRCDGGARVLSYLFLGHSSNNRGMATELLNDLNLQLKTAIQKAETDLVRAVSEESTHGYFEAFRLLFECLDFSLFDPNFIQSLVDDLLSHSHRIWAIVKDVLSHDSPEGNLPGDFKDSHQSQFEASYGSATQLLLSYSWRSVKESSNLLRVLLEKVPNSFLQDEKVVACGDLILSQLAIVRHPGAFSSVYPTFITCCNRCNRSGSSLSCQPRKWLENNISLIQSKSQFITRRSGGLPFLITAVLTSEIDDERPLLQYTFNSLIEIAQSPIVVNESERIDLPQVNAFNCIRSIYLESQLATIALPYINDALELSLSKFADPTWAVRNCAVMLFATLQGRLFGSKKVQGFLPTVAERTFFSKYRGVRDILLMNLNIVASSKETEKQEMVFPILTIISRLQVRQGYNGLEELKPFVLHFLASNDWQVREMAAEAYPAFVLADDLFSESCRLLDGCLLSNQNQLFGFLTAIKVLLTKGVIRMNTTEVSFPPRLVQKVCAKAIYLVRHNPCAVTTKLAVQLLQIVSKDYEQISFDVIESLSSWYIIQETSTIGSLNGAKQLLASHILRYLLNFHLVLDDRESLRDLLLLSINSNFDETCLTALKFAEENVSKLDEDVTGPLVQVLWGLINSSLWSHVKATALILLEKLLVTFSFEDKDISNRIHVLFPFIEDHNSEDIKCSALISLAPYVARWVSLPEVYERNQDINFIRWFNAVRSLSCEEMPFPVRQAAFNSMASFLKVVEDKSSHFFSRVFLLAYFRLWDDDEELRIVAAKFFSYILNIDYAVPDKMTKEVIRHFDNHLSQHTDILYQIVLNFDLGQKRLKRYIDNNTLLFTVEKHNFYQDDILLKRQLNQLLLKNISRITETERCQLYERIKDSENELRFFVDREDSYLGWLKEEDLFVSLCIIIQDLDMFGICWKDLRKGLELKQLHPLVSSILLQI
ncbi:2'-O-ribose methyltransferase interacting protein [Komagataella phaffii CBS 7435]|uniref:Uncharacterized protein n=2 Tax=Komagataella phaffii TaxID=460519 RepID=C4R1L9_KOMPG|nr:uncharacterized protein PAS_chr2-1_0743 [Komagataella phaffii GS115]AOA62310.1 GQ67_00810T0 [Komagataella phaffii]CAH2448075.1 2'-O-ribose methyltransferase interacting protein [Komagataella phaffii CBS 7435]AOA66974.1 GQ68_00579T0 [Komagataella phaffii GS115]CAY69393.1 Putative protein of unknown function [Komagataella phaffii GS115]SCV12031.1 2'-O-ribose methyltransferase interacting protein [Komagataella phaffii CBS 7435]